VEQRLRVQERQLAMIFNSSRDMMMLVRVEPGVLFRVVSVNREYLSKVHAVGYRYTAEDFAGKTCDEVMALFGFPPTAVEAIRAQYRQVIETRQVLAYDEEKSGPAGVFHGRTTISPLLDETGACAFVLYATQDITAQRVAEQERQRSEEMLRAILDHSFQFIGLLDREGRLLRPNQTSLDAVGVSREEVVGKYFWDTPWWTHSPAEQARLREAVGRAAQGEFVRYETTHPTAAGRMLTIDFSLKPVRDERGTVVAIIPEGRDITESKEAEQALRESEEKFAKAFRASPQAMSIASLDDGRYLEINQAHQELFGYQPEEVVGRTPAELGIVMDASVTLGALNELRNRGRVRDLQLNARTRDGRVITVLNNAELIRVGGRDCALLTSRDITAQLQAERALRESEAKFAAAFRVSPDFSAIVDYETGRHIEVNDAIVSFFGYSREEIIGKTALELGMIPSEEPRARMLELLNRDGKVRGMRTPARTRDGREVTVELSAEIVHIRGRKCILRISRDITTALKAEQALRESEEKFARAFRSSPQALVITEIPSGRYIDVNLGFERLTGYSREEVIGRTAVEIGIWENQADREDLMRRMQREGWARDVEYVFRGKQQQRVITRCSFEQIEVSGRRCLLSVIEDITERRRAEEGKAALEEQLRQNQKLEALGTLAGGIAHDFNNILTAIIVNQELALMDIHEPVDLRRRLEEIGQASGRAKELVRQILTFSRQQPHEKLRQRLQLIVREALGLLRSSLPTTIEIRQDLSPETPPVLADASQIHQVVMNLCTNAAHAMRESGGRLTVRLASRQLDAAACCALPGLQPGAYAQLTVTDTGHGMDAATLAHIFEPFFTTKGPGEGTGLGLAMVHGIVQNHHGGIFVHSLPGAGTTFDLFFPEDPGTDSTAPMSGSAIVPGHGESVLVVDDEESICFAVGAMLRKIGYRVETFTDPSAALERFKAGPSQFQLLLTDRTMPHITGPALIARMREWWPGLPALLMSGHDSPGGTHSVPPHADYGLVAKPLDIADLSRVVRDALKSSSTS
jgi:PAS domain S-box-containing protein